MDRIANTISFRIADYPDIDPNISYTKSYLERNGYTLVPIYYNNPQYNIIYSDVAKKYGIPITVVDFRYNLARIRKDYECVGNVCYRGENENYAIFTDDKKTFTIPIAEAQNIYATEDIRDYYVLREREITSRPVKRDIVSYLEESFKRLKNINANNYSYMFLSSTQITVLEHHDVSLELSHYLYEGAPEIYAVY